LFRSASGVAIGVAAAAILMSAVGLVYYAPRRTAYSDVVRRHSPAGEFDG
jgi:hypothetical protein